ncbi:MAG: hypothetical protein RLZZ206_2238 [Cyanobacteriota bacterium]
MRRPPLCGLHQGLPRAAQTLRCMPARHSNPKPPKAADAKGDLAALGFRVADSGPHTSKTLMLQELEALLAAVPADAPAKAYRAAVVEENVLGKRTLSTRKETASRLIALHGLDPTKSLFRVLRRLWDVEPAARPQLALLNGLARDPLLMATTGKVMLMAQGELLQRSEMVAAVQGFTHDRLSPKVLDAVARNAASSWTQSGHLQGKVKKVRQPLRPQPVALALAMWLGYACGKRGKALLNTPWATALDSSSSGLLELAQQAKRLGLLKLSHGAGVVSIDPSGLDPLHGGQQS